MYTTFRCTWNILQASRLPSQLLQINSLVKQRSYSSLSRASKTKWYSFSNCQKVGPARGPALRWAASSVSGKVAWEQMSATAQKWVGRWLFGCAGMVFGAVTIGGLTRLTESGLSMTDWHLFGKRPALTEEEWITEFQRYQQFPEYKIKNKELTLAEFKFIWWMEYGHRQWGRLIGAVFAVPAAVFWYKGFLTTALKKTVLICGALIGAQGLLGWYMVQSGLEDRFHEASDVPRVSQYRLTAHLGMAFVLYQVFFWSALTLMLPALTVAKVTPSAQNFRKLAYFTRNWIFVTAMSGALVAGLDAGLVYNTFPKMADRWVPSDLLALSPVLRNFTENHTTVQFDHRIMGTTTLVLATTLAVWAVRRRQMLLLPPRATTAATALAAAAWMQVVLGISTLLLHVPTALASLHQNGSLVTLSAAVWLAHELRYVRRIVK